MILLLSVFLFSVFSLAVSMAVLANPAQADAGKSPRSRSARAKVSGQLVPPPPAVMPSLLPVDNRYVSLPVDFLSADEAFQKHAELSKKLQEEMGLLKELEEHAEQTGRRAVLFDSLYVEGVVSRSELTGARRQAQYARRQVDEVKSSIATLSEAVRMLSSHLGKDKVAPAGAPDIRQHDGK